MNNLCPVCNQKSICSCRCMRSDSTCKNGHSWHTCIKHHVIVLGESDHSIDSFACTCKKKD